AVPVFRPARFPGPLPEPAVRLSPQRALRKPQVGLTDPLVQLGLDLQYPSSAGRERPPDRRCSPAQPPDLPWTSAVGLLDPFAVCGAFLRSDYYGSSAPSRGPGSATGLPTSGLAARGEGDRGWFPRSPRDHSFREVPSYIPVASPRLRRRPSPRPPARPLQPGVGVGHPPPVDGEWPRA